MSKKTKKTEVVIIRVTPETKKALADKAKKKGTTITKVIETALSL